jgi:hypothetical protein
MGATLTPADTYTQTILSAREWPRIRQVLRAGKVPYLAHKRDDDTVRVLVADHLDHDDAAEVSPLTARVIVETLAQEGNVEMQGRWSWN